MKAKKVIFSACVCPILAAVMFAGQVALAVIPNVEVVSFLVIVFSLSLDKKMTIAIIYIFVLLEGLRYGFGIWWTMYLYVWTVLAVFCFIFRRIKSIHFWAIASAVYGLSFGALCTIPYLFTKGWAFGVSWWISGLYFDLMHGFGNFAVCMFLYYPAMRAMDAAKKMTAKYL